MLVLSATGVQSEANLPFACLHQLLRPVFARRVDLPAPQREALEAAFGMAGNDWLALEASTQPLIRAREPRTGCSLAAALRNREVINAKSARWQSGPRAA